MVKGGDISCGSGSTGGGAWRVGARSLPARPECGLKGSGRVLAGLGGVRHAVRNPHLRQEPRRLGEWRDGSRSEDRTSGKSGGVSGSRRGRSPERGRVHFRGVEDRLNPVVPPGVDDTTLGGYAAVHGRAPGFEGPDGVPYTAAIEIELDDDGSWVAYLVFVRWAGESGGIMGHVVTEDVARGVDEGDARSRAEALPLTDVKRLLDAAVEQHEAWFEEHADPPVDPDVDEV